MEQIATNLGINGVITFILYFFMKQTFDKESKNKDKEMQLDILKVESHKADIDKLCDKIDKLVGIIYDLQLKDTEKTIEIQNNIARIEDMYIRIAKKQDDIREMVQRTDIRTQLCPKVPKNEEEKK